MPFHRQTITAAETALSPIQIAAGSDQLVVKNLSLKVDATSQVPSDVLTLFNAATGQLIGTMKLTGVTTTKLVTYGQYSFQGTLSAPVTTLLLKTGLNGSTTFVVSQK